MNSSLYSMSCSGFSPSISPIIFTFLFTSVSLGFSPFLIYFSHNLSSSALPQIHFTATRTISAGLNVQVLREEGSSKGTQRIPRINKGLCCTLMLTHTVVQENEGGGVEGVRVGGRLRERTGGDDAEGWRRRKKNYEWT